MINNELRELFRESLDMSDWLCALCNAEEYVTQHGIPVVTYHWDIPHTDVVIALVVDGNVDCNIYTSSVKRGSVVEYIVWRICNGVAEILKVSDTLSNIHHAYKCWKMFRDMRVRELEGFSDWRCINVYR